MCTPARCGGSAAPLLVLAGIVAAPIVLAALGLVATIAQALASGLIAAAVILAVGWVSREVVAELLSRWLTRRELRARPEVARRETAHVITDLRPA